MGTEYISSLPGILKIVTVCLGILVVGLAGYGYDNAATLSGESTKIYWDTWCPELEKAGAYTCPWYWAATMLLIVAIICLIVSIIGLIIFILMVPPAILKTIDFIGHIFGGIVLIVSGILAIVYGCQGSSEKWCHIGKIDYKLPLIGESKETENVCSKLNKELYQPIMFIAAGVFAIINGFVYIFAGLKSR